ncbi:hypothetical protein E4U44_003935 [Claviceps purpurea]|nr:hypothetical protein E4U51_005400 [Claviceps purpurea]KAG6325464.1 hypothetical protein E4U44_003935 [Claviceps purpurea]
MAAMMRLEIPIDLGLVMGFELVPPLTTREEDKFRWQEFLADFKQMHLRDPRVEWKDNYILFKFGERPMLPYEGHKFLRFSSEGPEAIADKYVQNLHWFAKRHFGDRARFWDEMAGQSAHYPMDKVRKSWKSYKTPDEVEAPVSTSSALHEEPLYEIKELPGNRKGLVALSHIPKGTRLVDEEPLITLTGEFGDDEIVKQLRKLPKEKTIQFLHLPNRFPRESSVFSGIVKTNVLPGGEEGADNSIGLVYHTISHINNGCRPNCQRNYNNKKRHEYIHAIRDIAAGEEIVLSDKSESTYAERHSYLKKKFGSDCTCALCSLPVADRRASDRRRERMQELDAQIGTPLLIKSNPGNSLELCHQYLKLLDAEFPESATALHVRLYFQAFQICAVHGDEARASVFGKRAYEACLLCKGEDSPSTKSYKFYSQHPAEHFNFQKCGQRWKTSMDMVDESLETEKFEKWLWRA